MKISVLDRASLGMDTPLEVLSKLGEVEIFDATAPEQMFERCADSDVIVINKTFHPYDRTLSMSAKTDAGNREVFVQDELKEVIRQIRAYIRKEKIQYGHRSKLFFPGIDGKPIQYPAYNKYLRENTERIIGRPLTPHALRHTHVSLLAESGVSLDAISRRVGHEDSRITKEIYLHVTEKQKQKDNDEIKQIKIL